MATKTSTVSNQQRGIQSELERLQSEKVQCLARAKQVDEQHTRTWKQEIAALAFVLEREYLLLEQKWLVPTICAEISRLYMEQGISVWQNIDRYIDAKYKDQRYSHPHPLSSLENVLIEDSTRLNLASLTKQISDIRRESFAEIVKAAERFTKKARAYAALEHIPLQPDDNSSIIDHINDSGQQSREHVTIDRPAPAGSLMFDAIGRKIERWKSVQQRVFEFPPSILEKDQEYADALEAADVWMDPILDLKYSKSLPDWLRAESYRDTYGKHAAGVMSYSVTNLCATCSDEKTKYWVRMEPKYAQQYSVYECLQCRRTLHTECEACLLPMRQKQREEAVQWVCPECEGTTGIKRNLTREQIGDKSSIIVDIAHKIAMSFPDCAVFYSWYRDWLERRVSGRKSRLSDDLSEHA